MTMAVAEDPVFESLQLLPSKIDSFTKSLSQICKTNNAGASAFCKELEDHYRDLHHNVQNLYEELLRKEKKLEANSRESANEAQKASEKTELSSAKVPAFAAVEVRKEIRSLCDKMDGRGLRNYIVDNRKGIEALRSELPSALYKAPDSAKLVLKALEGYDFSESDFGRADKKESVASVSRRACILLLECLVPVLEAIRCNISSEAKNKARELAKAWGKRIGIERNASTCNTLDAQAFLQLLATFGIASEFDEDQLCNLVLVIPRRKQTPELCKSLGLAPRIPEIVDKLCKSGKQIEALSFAHAFDMMDKVDAVSLLKAYLKDTQEAAQAFLKRGHASPASQNDATMKEVSGLKTVIKAVENYNLGNLYPTDDLHERIAQLEKSKAKRKKSINRGPHKRRRPSGSGDDTRRRSSGSGDDTETEVPLAGVHIALPDAKYDSAARSGGAAALGQASHNFDGNQSKNEARSPERYPLSYRGSNTGLIGSSVYGSVAAGGGSNTGLIGSSVYGSVAAGGGSNTGLFGSSVYGSSAPTGAFATPSSNVVKNNYERGGPQIFTAAFVGSNKTPSGSAAGSFATVFPNGPPNNYEKRSYENYAPPFGGTNVSPVGSSLYGSGPPTAALTTPYSNVPLHNYERRGTQHSYERSGPQHSYERSGPQHSYERSGPEPYSSNLSASRGPVGLSAYGSDMFPLSSNAAQSNYEGKGTECNTPAFDNVDRKSMSSSVYGSGAPNAVQTTPSSTFHGYQFDGVDRRSLSSSVYGSGAHNAAHTTPSSTVRGYQFDSVDRRSTSSSVYGSGASATATARQTSSTFHGYQLDGGLPSSSSGYRDAFLH